MKLKTKISISVISVLLIFAGIVMNLEVSIRQGSGGHYRTIKMPLYVKWTEFLARHYEYARIAKEVTSPYKTDEEKALAIFKWTRANIKDVPKNMPLTDDHILNIIIRGYGVPEQFQDVFTTLCTYSNIPAFWRRIYDNEHKVKYGLSFVRLNGKWRVFDAYYGIYFRTNGGDIASVDDIVKDSSLIKGKGIDTISIMGVPYDEFYHNLKPITIPMTSRAEKQMPLKRILFELKKLIRAEKEENDNHE